MITQTINKYQFMDAFNNLRPNNFSDDGLEVLFEYLDNLDHDIDLDVISLCCQFSEYENWQEFQSENPGFENLDELQQETLVLRIPKSEGFVIQDF